MWFMIMAVTATLLLFWHRVSFPIGKQKSTASYSIIIPARNEEKNLKRLLPSILAVESKYREIIVVDDHSDDQTSETAALYEVKVIENPPLPNGWMGKSWACYNGAKAASGQSLFFLDADTWFSPLGAEKIMGYYETKGSDSLITVHPYHYMGSFWEKLSAVFHLVVFASSGITSIFKKMGGAQGGFGPCLIIDADTYWDLGGHHAIRSEIVEHLAFARKAESKGIKTYAFSGKNVVNMRMYEASFRAVAQGWSKSFASGASTASPIMSFASIIWITSVVSYLVNLFETGWWTIVGYGLLALLLYRFLQDVGNFRWYDGLLFPVYFLFFVLLFAFSFVKTYIFKQSTWKGRQIVGKEKRGSS
ncbi:glycosyltransferase [Halobacillus mangrovi]|uniref:4,4'-diaponeurosporenoate glycosyltransferase n=1 Tax=Halobacillus mangrovi TaxID=402384 RepID=A0A1W5ZX14_9BACI|nr:glycosyltransferase family 2 protein [Halobacillus mangrovi]ARI77876.1 glycosyl transferase family 2 [Halobacillus mangrovi]